MLLNCALECELAKGIGDLEVAFRLRASGCDTASAGDLGLDKTLAPAYDNEKSAAQGFEEKPWLLGMISRARSI